VLVCTVGAAGVLAAVGLGTGASHGQQRWSGQWDFVHDSGGVTGGFAFRHETDENGATLLQQIGGTPCPEPTDYFAGGYTVPDGTPPAGTPAPGEFVDTGKIRACVVDGNPLHIKGRYESNGSAGPSGNIDLTLDASGASWTGTFTTDGQTGVFGWHGTFDRHFEDGADDPSDPPYTSATPPEPPTPPPTTGPTVPPGCPARVARASGEDTTSPVGQAITQVSCNEAVSGEGAQQAVEDACEDAGGYANECEAAGQIVSQCASLQSQECVNAAEQAAEDATTGTRGADTFRGTPGDDLFRGGPGNDKISGGAGDDRLIGGGGKDTLKGGPGDDDLRAGAGNDQVIGGGGDDQVSGGGGIDRCASTEQRQSCENGK
jgi:hypothetical protein